MDILTLLTKEEKDKLKSCECCPLCGFEFVGYPTGWAWEIHISDCLKKAGRVD